LAAAGLVLALAALAAFLPDRWPRRMLVTAYCPCTECCGPNAQGITASGRPVSANGAKFVAADPALPFGTMLVIPGYNNSRPVEVLDRGGAIRGDRLDVYFPTHEEARRWGRQWLMVQRLKGKGGGTRRAAHAR
jgi:3D (Asp-Asp-Asp) domain-containing protein